MVTPSTNPPQFWSSRSAGSHIPGKAVLSKAEAGKRNNVKNQCPILSCHQGVARHCPLGSCQSCLCPWEMRPAGGRATRGGMFIPVLTFPLHPTAMGIPENPQQAREVLHPRLFAGISPSSPTLLSFPTHCLKAVTTDLGKASSEPRISHPRLQDAELSRALLPFLTLLNLRMFPEKPIFSR